MTTDAITDKLQEHLYGQPGTNVFAVLDGASIPNLLPTLDKHQPPLACLYRGDLPADVAETAPYLVLLEPGSPFAKWVLKEGWGKHWGVFAVTGADLRAMRRHCRTILLVKDGSGKPLYFRYYDPRVLQVFLPTCNSKDTRSMFGPVVNYVMEGKDPQTLVRFWQEASAAKKEEIKLDGE